MGIDLVQLLFIHKPKHDILYMDESHQMCFQCLDDLAKAPTKHLFHLRLECMGHKELEDNYYFLISLELNKRKEDMGIPDYSWIKPKIRDEVDEFYNRAYE